MSGAHANWSFAEASARRLERHALATPAADFRPADIVDLMCGAHAQVMSAAELSVALRMEGAARDVIRDALWSEHALVKTFGPRGTVHLLPARDLPMWTGALSAAPPATPAAYPEGVLMTAEQTDQVIETIGAALSNAELTIDELEEAVVDATGQWAAERVLPAWYEMWPRWRQAVHKAAHRGVLCFGPNRGRKATYTNPHRWLPGFKPIPADTALAELVRRYLHAYGPAAPHHFAQWLAAPRGWALALFESLADRLRLVNLEGVSAYVSADDDEPPTTQPAGVRLLPYFDAFVVGCHPRAHLFPGRAAERALSGGQAGNFPVILVDGIVGGVWHQRRSGRMLDVTVELFDRFTARQRRELELQVQRVGEILEAKPRWTVGKVAVGGHA